MFCIGRYFQALEQINKVLGLCDVISSTKVQKNKNKVSTVCQFENRCFWYVWQQELLSLKSLETEKTIK